MKKLFIIIGLVLVTAILTGMYPVRDDFGVRNDWWQNWRSSDDATAYYDTIVTFIVCSDTESLWVTDTLHTQTFYADSGFKVRSAHFNFGQISTNTVTGALGFAMGDDHTVSGIYSFGGGHQANVSGNASFAWGNQNVVSGGFAGAFGDGNTVSDTGSYAFGGDINISGEFSFAGGHIHVIGSDYSTAFGHANYINQHYSFAVGGDMRILGDATDSTSFGFGTGVIDSVPHAFLIGDNAGDILARPHTFKSALDSANIFVAQLECSSESYFSQTAYHYWDFTAQDTLQANIADTFAVDRIAYGVGVWGTAFNAPTDRPFWYMDRTGAAKWYVRGDGKCFPQAVEATSYLKAASYVSSISLLTDFITPNTANVDLLMYQDENDENFMIGTANTAYGLWITGAGSAWADTVASGLRIDSLWAHFKALSIELDTLQVVSYRKGAKGMYMDPSQADTNWIYNTADTFYVGIGDNPTKVGNSLIVETDGDVVVTDDFTLLTTVWQCEDINVSVPQLGIGNPPAENTEDEFPTHDYSPTSDEEIYFTQCLTNQYKAGDSVKVEIDWFVDDGAAADTYVVWGVEYKMETDDSLFTFANTTTVLETVLVKAANEARHETEIYLVTTGFIKHGRVKCRLFKDADNGDDNFKDDARASFYRFAFKKENP